MDGTPRRMHVLYVCIYGFSCKALIDHYEKVHQQSFKEEKAAFAMVCLVQYGFNMHQLASSYDDQLVLLLQATPRCFPRPFPKTLQGKSTLAAGFFEALLAALRKRLWQETARRRPTGRASDPDRVQFRWPESASPEDYVTEAEEQGYVHRFPARDIVPLREKGKGEEEVRAREEEVKEEEARS